MQKVFFLLLLGLFSAGAQEAKSDSATKTNAPTEISAGEAKERIGAQAVVKGKIVEVNVGERVTRLNFEQAYPKSPFTAVIFPRNMNQFPEIEKLNGKTVQVSGKITAYHEHPEIVLTSSNQVKVVQVTNEPAEKK